MTDSQRLGAVGVSDLATRDQALTSTRIGWGAFALALSAALFAVYGFVHPVSSNDLTDPLAVAQVYSSSSFVIALASLVASYSLLPVAILTIYAALKNTRAERWAFGALVLFLLAAGPSVGGQAASLFGWRAASEVVVRGAQGGVDVLRALLGGPTSPVLLGIVGLVARLLGAVVLGIAVWRSSSLPKWAGVLYALGFILQITSFAPGDAQMVARVVDGALGGVGGIWLALSIWRGASTSRRAE